MMPWSHLISYPQWTLDMYFGVEESTLFSPSSPNWPLGKNSRFDNKATSLCCLMELKLCKRGERDAMDPLTKLHRYQTLNGINVVIYQWESVMQWTHSPSFIPIKH